jgi:glutamate N-acetyltransferase/amino-acid N-acetyltransferase
MPVGLPLPTELLPVEGIRLNAVAAGIRYPDRKDLVLIEIADGSKVAGVFTRNAFCAAPVIVSRQHLLQAAPRYLLINSGNANAGTGTQGMQMAERSCLAVAQAAGVEAKLVLPFSTGVIGEPLNVDAIEDALPDLINGLEEENWLAAAQAIMTTDTQPKGFSTALSLSTGSVHITGIAKGAGMIRPDMATMLAYIATDLEVDQGDLDHLHTEAVAASFNRVTVDGDTSTNDACMLMATGKSGVRLSNQADRHLFTETLISVYQKLAQALIRDGEGVTKFVEISVVNAQTQAEAADVAYTVAHSPLVKTALFASDPNWGRILAAVGRSGIADMDVGLINIYLDDVCIVEKGGRAQSYTEEQGQEIMDREEIRIQIDLGRGQEATSVWTTDLSHEYVTINAEYRT